MRRHIKLYGGNGDIAVVDRFEVGGVAGGVHPAKFGQAYPVVLLASGVVVHFGVVGVEAVSCAGDFESLAHLFGDGRNVDIEELARGQREAACKDLLHQCGNAFLCQCVAKLVDALAVFGIDL